MKWTLMSFASYKKRGETSKLLGYFLVLILRLISSLQLFALSSRDKCFLLSKYLFNQKTFYDTYIVLIYFIETNIFLN